MKKCSISTIIRIFVRKYIEKVSQKILSLTPAGIAGHLSGSKDIYVSEGIAIIHSLMPLRNSSVVDYLLTPQYVELGRILLVTRGKAVFQVNLVPFETERGDVLVIPQNTYISVSSLSEDYDGQMLSFDHQPVDFEKCARLRLSEEDFLRVRNYVELLWQTVHDSYDPKSVEHLQTALLYDLKHMHVHQYGDMGKEISRGQALFRKFMDMLGRREPLQRSVKAYASALCVSPNHLSAVVRQQSGRSVMDWLNAHAILRAQVLLHHTDLPIYEIAERLDFQSATFFSHFFKRETGITPKEYRHGVTGY